MGPPQAARPRITPVLTHRPEIRPMTKKFTAALCALLVAASTLAVVAQPAAAHSQTTTKQRCSYDPFAGQQVLDRDRQRKPHPRLRGGHDGHLPELLPDPSGKPELRRWHDGHLPRTATPSHPTTPTTTAMTTPGEMTAAAPSRTAPTPTAPTPEQAPTPTAPTPTAPTPEQAPTPTAPTPTPTAPTPTAPTPEQARARPTRATRVPRTKAR